MQADIALRTLCPPDSRMSHRINPAQEVPTAVLNADETRHVAGIMRVNHAGEVCAQALYQGQALTANLTHIKEQMMKAAEEEIDHLAWCEERLNELNSKPSKLNALWYIGSFLMGAGAGIAGDRWSLGFVAETEQQVAQHLEQHISKLPEHDLKTQAILSQMQRDEADHADLARKAGAKELPFFLKYLMHNVSKLLTYGSYYI
jgi:ubiquinone biosynthesis monooxygenase Coq7